METYKLTLKGTALRWDDKNSRYDRIEVPIEFSLMDFEEVGIFVGELAYAAEDTLQIEIKREEV